MVGVETSKGQGKEEDRGMGAKFELGERIYQNMVM